MTDKIKVSRKDISNRYDIVFFVGYCEVQRFKAQLGEPLFYNCGTFGWNWDGYTMHIGEGSKTRSVCILDDYRNPVRKGLTPKQESRIVQALHVINKSDDKGTFEDFKAALEFIASKDNAGKKMTWTSPNGVTHEF